ncbi:glycosyltransferase family 2 protein [Paracraurococcus lichenis]|uniref:Glycosyltransferase n=1 Tax=Paracraurococcus lichenis TaxID=3064888 RepID=A0ABT9EBQ0_9PROT|nr:glycosyltransferase [Paracraurococcus sp. LOR1-02]MDO9713577.1 glycosyltransferase [Paracraurococcus sp. LOR1-02]
MRRGKSGADPIAIIHQDLDAAADAQIRLPGQQALVVFWVNDTPVGQIYAEHQPDGCIMLGELVQAAVSRRAVLAARALSSAVGSTRVSVVICTRDRSDALARCLASLQQQSRRPDQVLVVDNASRDGRTEAAARAAGVEYVREDRPGLDIARNTGVLHATGDIVAYTDDDIVLHPRWLERMTAAFDALDIMSVTGLVLPAELETPAQQVFEDHWGFGRGFERIDFGREFFAAHRRHGCPTWEIGAGASMAFRRKAFDLVGLFDERLDVGAAGCSGDSEYWHRLLVAGWRCRYEPAAVAFHYHRRTFEGLSRQLHAYMRGHVVALLVQFKRNRSWGDLRRLFITLPRWYAKRGLKRLLRGQDPSTMFLWPEVKGSVGGLLYYLGSSLPSKHSKS